MDSSLPSFSVHGNSPGMNTGIGCHDLLQGIFPTKGSSLCFPRCRWILYHLSHQKSQIMHCFSSVQSLSHVWLFVTPCTAAVQASPSLLNLMSIEPVMPPTISSSVVPFSSCLQSFQASGSFPMSEFFASCGQSIGESASTPFFPMNIQDWFLLGWTGLICLQSKGLSRVFSNTTVKSIDFLALSFLYSPTLTYIHDYWKNHSFD